MSSQLIELSNDLAQVTERVASATVAVHTEPRGSSSGVIWRDGVIVTAEHALRRDEDIHVTLPDARVVQATLAGRDPSTDIAVLKCPEATRTFSAFGDAGTLKAGHLTLVIGRTRASGPVAALGVVSLATAERRTWTGTSLSPFIRLDVGLQPTAVGGAIADAQGKIVGMATGRFARFGAVAIPVSAVNAVIDTLLEKGHIPRGFLGVGLQPIRLPEEFRKSRPGGQKTAVIVLQVEPNGPAAKASLMIGDILVSIGGQPVTRLEDVQSYLHGGAVGKTLAVKFLRGGAVQSAEIVVSEREQGEN